ncbi:MAG: response regulator [Myxococcaceae bacterium]|nr:response regulator [Myxococcaceae bacterium]
MTLRLQYPDKYRLWSDLVKAQTDRVFIPTDTRLVLGDLVPVEVVVHDVPLAVRAQVVGMRRGGPRFVGGVYVHFDAEEVDKCRRFLGLMHEPPHATRGRRSRRVNCDLPLRFTKPEMGSEARARNLSETGLLFDGPVLLRGGQFVMCELGLEPDSPVCLKAEVMRDSPDGHTGGLRFIDVDEQTVERLHVQLIRLEANAQATPPSVLIADDEPAILDFVKRSLTQHGYEVYTAKSGVEAMALIREVKPKLVVLDILMPGMDGADICKSMRADVELLDIPVIFASSLEPQRLHQVADDSGATDYLAKPFPLTDLLNLVGNYLRA